MVLTSLVVSLVPVAVLSLQSQSDLSAPRGVLRNVGVASLRIAVALIITLCLNIILKVCSHLTFHLTCYSLKVWMNQTADNHIFKFLKNKFTHDSTDFETQLYLCNEAFQVSFKNII